VDVAVDHARQHNQASRIECLRAPAGEPASGFNRSQVTVAHAKVSGEQALAADQHAVDHGKVVHGSTIGLPIATSG
jgi:hypothetical protein